MIGAGIAGIAGIAGCALADELSAYGKKNVLVIEAGSKDSLHVVKLPSGTSVKGIKRFNWGYQTSRDPARNGLVQNWIRGKVVGGSSSTNGMNYERGNAADRDASVYMLGWTGAYV